MHDGHADFIAGFKFAVILIILLDSIICLMGQFIVNVFQGVWGGAGPDVSVFEKIDLEVPVHDSPQHVTPEVELSFLEQEGLFDILLDDYGFLDLAGVGDLGDALKNLPESLDDTDPITTKKN